ncbi:uncharacterized protein ISCGN_009960 [Ixodes scapularis]
MLPGLQTMASFKGSLNLGTLNVRGLTQKRRQSQLYRLVKDLDIDVLAAQETKVKGEEESGSMVHPFTSRYFTCMNHLWIVTLKSDEAKQRLVAAKKLQVKGKRCLVLDPDAADVRLRLHWIPFHVPDEAVRKALEPFEKVEELTREKWRAEGFTGVQSTTRLVRLVLKEGVTQERLPHQLRIAGGNVLVVVPGRAPQCLRCKGTGHIRRECRVPRCDACHRYGHETETCAKTFANVTQEAAELDDGVLNMDEEEAEATARDAGPETLPPGAGKTSSATVSKEVHPAQEQPVKDAVMPESSQASSSSAQVTPVFQAPALKVIQVPALRGDQVSYDQEPEDKTLNSLSEDESENSVADENLGRPEDLTARSVCKWRTVTRRRERFDPTPRGPLDERRRPAQPRKQWILNTLLKDRVHVAFSQETKLSNDVQVEEMTRFVERHFAAYHSKANGMRGGSAILIRKRTEMKVCPEWETDRNGRVCAVEVLHQGELHKLISVYAPNEVAEREHFFKSLRQYVDTPRKTVLAGDFNCVLTQKDCSKRLVSDVSRVELRKLMRDFDLVDMKNHSEMEGSTYTHWQGSCHARLDRVYLSGEFTVSKITSQVQPLAFSDNALVTV